MSTIETTEQVEGGRGRAPWLMAALGIGAVAVVGGGAWAVTSALGGGGDQPADVLPASSVMYARLDVDPQAGQKVSAVRFFRGLDPEVQERIDAGEWKQWAWERLSAEDGGAPAGLDYDKDIEPWLGDRVGMSVVPRGDDQEPIVAVAVQVKDEGAAKAALDRLKAEETEGGSFDYFFQGDYALITQADALEQLRSEVEAGPLVGDDEFSSDMGDLGEDGVASVWMDMAEVAKLGDSAALSADGTNPATAMAEGALGLDQDALAEQYQGRFAATTRFTPDAIEVFGVTRGAADIVSGEGETPRLALGLPADTAGVISLEHGADTVRSMWEHYAQLLPKETTALKEQAAEQGYTLPDDVATLLGDSLTLSVGPGVVDAATAMGTDASSMTLPVAYRTSTDTARLQSLLDTTYGALGLAPDNGFVFQRVDDSVLTLGMDQAYLDSLAAGGDRLEDADGFTAAVPGAEEADSIFYVNADAFEQYYLPEVTDENARTALEKVSGVGMSSQYTGAGEAEFTFRVVANDE